MTNKNRERKKYFFFLFILLVLLFLLFSIYALFIPRTQPPPEAFGDLPTKTIKPYEDSYGNLPPQPEEEPNDEPLDSESKSTKDKASHGGGGGGGQAKFEDLSKDAWARQFRHHIGEGSGGINVTQTER